MADRGIAGVLVPTALEGAIDAYRSHFGAKPNVADLIGKGRDRQLADLIWVAIRVGRPFDAEAAAKAWGMKSEVTSN